MNPSDFPSIGLLIIDVQPAFLKVIPHADELLKRIRFSLSVAKLFNLPVLFTEQVPEKLGGTEESLLQITPEAPRLSKQAFPATEAEGFQAWASGHQVECFLIAGIETPVCVYQTAIACLKKDIDCTLLTDAVGARREKDAEATLRFLSLNGAHCLPSEAVFYSMLKSAAHPLFREYTKLVASHV